MEEKKIKSKKLKVANEEIDKIEIVKKEKTKENIFRKIHIKKEGLIYSLVTLVLCVILFGSFYQFYLKNLVIETTKLVKDVTVTDSGIADAVEKVYDSVVVIENYVQNKLYSTGTGFVFKTNGDIAYILTNSHVIDSANEVKVTFTNNKTVTAKVVGSDDYSDIAVLSVPKENIISVATTGSSKNIRVGDTTFTVGAPIDSSVYSWTVTRGILSGKERLVEVTTNNNSNYVMEVLQTDAAINSGNSGGPLCSSNGEVIGITNMKLASSSIEGMGFAIPIDTAVKYAESIISGKAIIRPYLGISIYDSGNYFNSDKSGVYVESVESGSLADKSGIEKDDKILKINDIEITSTSYFKYQLYKYDIGDKISITIERNGKEKVIKITLKSNSEVN